MKLYDENIKKLKCESEPCFYKDPGSIPARQICDREALILKSDMQTELGGGGCRAVSGMAFTTSRELVPADGIYEIRPCGEAGDRAAAKTLSGYPAGSCLDYVRFTLIRLNEDVDEKKAQELYALLRKIDYLRYHMYLSGVAMRITSAAHREVLRISKDAAASQITAEQIMKTFLEAYKNVNLVEAVQIYYVVSEPSKSARQTEFWNSMEKLALSCESITESLNVIFKGLNMDCSTCGQKAVCDTVEGMRELHEGLQP